MGEVGALRNAGEQFCKLIDENGAPISRAAAEAMGYTMCSGKRCRAIRLGTTPRCPCGGVLHGGGRGRQSMADEYRQKVKDVEDVRDAVNETSQRQYEAVFQNSGVVLSWDSWFKGIVSAVAGRPPAVPAPALYNAPAAAVDGANGGIGGIGGGMVTSPPLPLAPSSTPSTLFIISVLRPSPLPSAPAPVTSPDQPGGFERFKPLLHLYGDGDGQPMMDGDEMNHAAFVGTSGFGKTVAVVHNATLLSGFMGWTNGFAVAIMPRGTWKARGNSIYHQLLDERQVFFIEDYPTDDDKKALVAYLLAYAGWLHGSVDEHGDKMGSGLGLNTWVLMDDLLQYFISGSVPVFDLLANGRSNGLTLWMVCQYLPRVGNTGPIVRTNLRWIACYGATMPAALKFEEWCPADVAKELDQRYRLAGVMEKSKHTAAVLVPGSSGFYTLTAPHPDTLKIKRIGNLNLPFPEDPDFDLPFLRPDQDPDDDNDSNSGDDDDDYGPGGGGAAAGRGRGQQRGGGARGAAAAAGNRRRQPTQGGRPSQRARQAAISVAEKMCDRVIREALSKLIIGSLADSPLTLYKGRHRPRNTDARNPDGSPYKHPALSLSP